MLYTSLLLHPILGLAALHRRRTLRVPLAEAWQLLLGLSIPFLLAGHVVGTRVAHSFFGREDSYVWHAFSLWTLRPDLALKQTLLLLVVWAHVCIGLHYWLRLRPWYPRVVPIAYAIALLLPALALGGFTQMGREVTAWTQPEDLDRRARALGAARLPAPAQARLSTVEWTIYATFAAALGGVLLARGARRVVVGRRRVRISYPGGRRAAVPAGFTVLEASRLAGIPHAAVCGGRGRCSTCRVRVERGGERLPAPGDEEARVLRRVGAPPSVRLACQLRPVADVDVVPLIASLSAAEALQTAAADAGHEQEVAIVFADLRGFTTLAEQKLPYDVVYLLNRYFEAVGGAVRAAGGVANQFTGDGVMALFGVRAAPEAGCRDALRGAAGMVTSIEALNVSLAGELPAPLRLGIGIHVGPAVVGYMGYAEAAYLTAVGDTVHVAARLEELTKTYGRELVISEAVAARAGVDVTAYPREELTLRNRSTPLAIRVIDDARRLAAALPDATGARV